MKLVDMKITKAERKKQMEPSTLMEDGPMYPWGLSISLDNAALEKLGLEEMPEVGELMMLQAQVKVTSCSSSDSEGGGKNQSCSLQIVAMGLSDAEDKADASDKLYEK